MHALYSANYLQFNDSKRFLSIAHPIRIWLHIYNIFHALSSSGCLTWLIFRWIHIILRRCAFVLSLWKTFHYTQGKFNISHQPKFSEMVSHARLIQQVIYILEIYALGSIAQYAKVKIGYLPYSRRRGRIRYFIMFVFPCVKLWYISQWLISSDTVKIHSI